jgi:SAM-dependent methyltransferase
MPEFLYDQILYPGLPFDESHPDRLATMGTLFGMHPAPPERCRVLEIACADGGNLIPLAYTLPDSRFFGFDLAQKTVENGREGIAALGLTNIRLEQMDLMDAGDEPEKFDYIIAHGLYSWVPEPVRDKLMATVKTLLAPQGIAYISYNALPGCRVREMFREMLLFHVRNLQGAEARIESARELLRCLTESRDVAGEAGAYLKLESAFLIEQGPVVLFHDEMAEIYHPVNVLDFVAHAKRFGLQFVSEANYTDMQPGKYPQDVIDRVDEWSAGDRLLREMYYDFMKLRTFRRTLLCHEGVEIASEPISGRIPLLCVASPVMPVSPEPDLRAGVAEEFRGVLNSSAKTAHPLAKAVLLLLSRAWPEAFTFAGLLEQASDRIGAVPDPDGLTQILLGTYAAGLVELHTRPMPCVAPGRFPRASKLARWQAGSGRRITTLRHTVVEMEGEIERRMITLLDGTRDMEALIRELGPMLNNSEGALGEQVEKNLKKLARYGLLEA